MRKVPDNGNSAVWGQASHPQTSLDVLEDGSKKTKVPDSDKPAELKTTLLRRRMKKEKAQVIEYINNKKEADLLVDVKMF